MKLGYAECYYIDVMKTLCSFLDRLDNKKNKQIKREIKYGSWKYHYTEEKMINNQSYIKFWQSDKSPIGLMKQIIERANTNMI